MLQDICHPILRLRHQNIWFHPPYKLLKFCYLRLLRSHRVRSMYWCRNKNMGCKFSRGHIQTSKYIISVCLRPLHCVIQKWRLPVYSIFSLYSEEALTDNDGLRGTFWPVKFWPPNFFMKSSLIYPIKHGEGKKSHLWAFWGSRGAKKPKSKNCQFWAKIFVFSYRKSSTT